MAKTAAKAQDKSTGFIRGLGLLDSTMIVAGSMIGSGIFIVSADIARQVGSAGGLILTWVKIGRASCRERVEISVVAVSLKKKKEEDRGAVASQTSHVAL